MKNNQFICVIDQRCSVSGHDTPRLLRGFGLSEGPDFWISGAGGFPEGLLRGEPGRRMVDADRLLVFVSVYHGGLEFAGGVARKIKAANPRARVIYRCVCAEDHNPDPEVFNGWMHTEDDDAFCDEMRHFLDPTLGVIYQGKLVVTRLQLTRLGGKNYDIGAAEISVTEVRSCDTGPDSTIGRQLEQLRQDQGVISVTLVRENFTVQILHYRLD